MITVAEARARGIALPTDDDAAQGIVDEQEAWLARRIGPLDGARTETFYVGVAATHGKLGLRRCTDSVVVLDNGVAVTHFRLIDDGAGIVHDYSAASQWWTGPYLTATYTPNDEDLVRGGIFDLCALAAQPLSALGSEKIGDYSYTNSLPGSPTVSQLKGAIVASILPKRDENYTLHMSRQLGAHDPVINRAEPVW